MENIISELRQVMSERQVMYQFLARGFRKEVDHELLSEISEMDFSINSGIEEFDQGFQKLDSFIHETNEATLDDLAADFARIFLGAGSGKPSAAFPYESVYTSPRGLLMQEARDKVVEIYRQEGLQLPANIHEPEDHIAFELSFVSHLCEKTGQALENQFTEAIACYLQMQSDFVEKHLCNWVPRLCQDVMNTAATDFYKALALITIGYLDIDRDLIVDLLNTLKEESV
jgi:putative dimethyl sulfoxide reductase chaperone